MKYRYAFRSDDRDELDAYIALMRDDTTLNAGSIVIFGSRYWRLGELIVAADCVAPDQVRNLG